MIIQLSRPLVISTSSVALQEAILGEYLPFLRQSLRHGLRPCHLPLTREANPGETPAANRKPRAAAHLQQAPLSKGAGRGASRGLGDCPAIRCRFIQATVNHRQPHRHAASFKRQPAVRQSLRHGLRPCHLPLTREANPPQTLRRGNDIVTGQNAV